ncbi:MAG: MATE family efflux transporter [Mogibacterium sp.]|nr:MATE family efflux transporter [Mogibacterium sp.]
MTDSERIIDYGTTYLSLVCWLSIGVMLQITMERLLQSTGKTQYVFICQASGAIINMIMDPILIFGLFGLPAMGVKGAAIATIFGQLFGAGLALYLNLTKNKEIELSFSRLKPNWAIMKEIYGIGIPSIVMQSIGSFMNVALNKILFTFTSTAVAAFGAYFKLQSFVFMPVFGMNAGVVPIAAYNYGARKRERLEEVMSVSARYAIIIMAVGTIVFWVFPAQLLSIFSASPDMIKLGTVMLRVISVDFPFAGYCIMRGAVFQALGKSTYGMYIAIMRQLVVIVPVAYLLSLTGNVNLVWFAFPIAEVTGTGMSIFFTKRIRRTIIEKI